MNILSTILLTVALGTLCYVVFVHIKFRKYEKWSKQFFTAKSSPHLSNVVIKNSKDIEKLKLDASQIKEFSRYLNNMCEKSLQKVGFVRYNPFKDTGGDISFSVALLDAKENGIVISSLHSREGTRVYSKFIEKGQTKAKLTSEEAEAVKRALGS